MAPTTRLPDRLSGAHTLQGSRGRLQLLPARGDHHPGSKGLPWAAGLSCWVSGSTLPQFSACSCPGLKTPLRCTLRARGTCYHLPSARHASPALCPHTGASQGDRPLLQRHLSGPHRCYLNFQMILLLQVLEIPAVLHATFMPLVAREAARHRPRPPVSSPLASCSRRYS